MSDVFWADVPGYEGNYKVSSDGRVFSVPRRIYMKDGRSRTIRGGILKPGKAGRGYLVVGLGERHKEYVHRLVAMAFLGNPGAGYEVNHKDENKRNNCATNLEWVTGAQNRSYGTRNIRCAAASAKRARSIIAIQDGAVVKEFPSVRAAGRDGYARYYISRCCKGRQDKYRGFVWRYKDDGHDTGRRGYSTAVLEATEKWA